MKKCFVLWLLLIVYQHAFSWGFFAHQKINYQAVFLLPPAMLVFYKLHIGFLSEHAVDPDKRRYALAEEAPRHYIDIDHYGPYPYDSLPRSWDSAIKRYGADSLSDYGILPWWIPIMQKRLVAAFKEKNAKKILKLSAEIGHYIADAHVPLHACSNHNGQLTNQQGIHGFWESRIPELLADKEWNLLAGKAAYISNPASFTWQRILESASAADTVLQVERSLTASFPPDGKYAFEPRKGIVVKQYSTSFSIAYDQLLNGMIERRMKAAIFAVASYWYTAWIDAGQPDLSLLTPIKFSEQEKKESEALDRDWRRGIVKGREE